MDVRQLVIRFHVWLVAAVCEVEGYIKKVDDLLVCLNCDLKACRFEHLFDFLLGFFNFFQDGFANCETIVTAKAIAPYQKALTESGYNHKLAYNPPQEQARRNKRKRTRNITWYNSPFNSNIKTNLGRKFLHIIDRCFPKHIPLHKIFNRQTLKLMHGKYEIYHLFAQQARSFKCNTLMSQPDTFNCRRKPDCALKGKCLQTNVIYQARETTERTTETYVGLATNFKERYINHQTSFRRPNRRNRTELSKHVWTLQDNNKPFQIKWKVLKKCKPYSNAYQKCNLCLYEKFIIICKKELCSLNRRNELASSCPHRKRYVLQNFRVMQLRRDATVT